MLQNAWKKTEVRKWTLELSELPAMASKVFSCLNMIFLSVASKARPSTLRGLWQKDGIYRFQKSGNLKLSLNFDFPYTK